MPQFINDSGDAVPVLRLEFRSRSELTLPPPSPQVREPIVRAPRIIFVSIFVLVAVHVATLFLSSASYDALIEDFGFVPAHVQAVWHSFGFNSATLWGLVPFLSYALLHGGFTHLAVNGVAFLIFGTVVARRVGTVRLLGLSIVTSVAAALAHLSMHWGESVPVIGASGAIAGYMGAASRFMFYDPRDPPTGPDHRLSLFARPVVSFALVWTLLNVAIGVTGFSPDGSQDLTAWEAHLGGFYAGLLLFPLFDRRRRWSNDSVI
jgi:membrane associated rhomboid family serine protease